jgi:hypothetical protein
MSGYVLVGTRKGAFIPDLGRQTREVGRYRPAFQWLEIYHLKDPRPIPAHLRLAVIWLVRADHPAFKRRREDVESAGTSSCTTASGTQWCDGTPHPWGSSASGTWNRR